MLKLLAGQQAHVCSVALQRLPAHPPTHQRCPLDQPVGHSISVLHAAQSAVPQAVALQGDGTQGMHLADKRRTSWHNCLWLQSATRAAEAKQSAATQNKARCRPGASLLALIRFQSSSVTGSHPARAITTCLQQPT